MSSMGTLTCKAYTLITGKCVNMNICMEESRDMGCPVLTGTVLSCTNHPPCTMSAVRAEAISSLWMSFVLYAWKARCFGYYWALDQLCYGSDDSFRSPTRSLVSQRCCVSIELSWVIVKCCLPMDSVAHVWMLQLHVCLSIIYICITKQVAYVLYQVTCKSCGERAVCKICTNCTICEKATQPTSKDMQCVLAKAVFSSGYRQWLLLLWLQSSTPTTSSMWRTTFNKH